jgi:hypothetical protein
MSNEKVSALPTVANALPADIIYAIQGGTSVQETLQQVLNLGLSNTVLNFAGNPNGNLAGTIYQLCWDTVDNFLYICTTSGSASTAVWTQITAASGTFDWVTVTGTSQTMTINSGYIANNGSLVTLTMPPTAIVGSSIAVFGLGAGGWTIAQPSSVKIILGNQATSIGVGGSLSSTNQFDVVRMDCIVANTTWSVFSSIGNLTVV